MKGHLEALVQLELKIWEEGQGAKAKKKQIINLLFFFLLKYKYLQSVI